MFYYISNSNRINLKYETEPLHDVGLSLKAPILRLNHSLTQQQQTTNVEIFSQMLVAKGGANVGVAVFVGVATGSAESLTVSKASQKHGACSCFWRCWRVNEQNW